MLAVPDTNNRPLPDSPHYQPMLDELAGLFTACQQAGHVKVVYETKLYAGRMLQ